MPAGQSCGGGDGVICLRARPSRVGWRHQPAARAQIGGWDGHAGWGGNGSLVGVVDIAALLGIEDDSGTSGRSPAVTSGCGGLSVRRHAARCSSPDAFIKLSAAKCRWVSLGLSRQPGQPFWLDIGSLDDATPPRVNVVPTVWKHRSTVP